MICVVTQNAELWVTFTCIAEEESPYTFFPTVITFYCHFGKVQKIYTVGVELFFKKGKLCNFSTSVLRF